MIWHELTPEDTSLLTRVREEFFTNSPIAIDTVKHSTQWVRDRRLCFGVWAGPKAETSNLLHEMAHFVEIDEARMNITGWGLKLPNRRYTKGLYDGCEPKTMQITAREIRVMALQHNLHEHLGIPTWRDQVVQLLRWLPDAHNVPGASKEAHNRWIMAQYDRLIKSEAYSFSRFNVEWKRRNEILRKRYN